jgi:hypothetical protein
VPLPVQCLRDGYLFTLITSSPPRKVGPPISITSRHFVGNATRAKEIEMTPTSEQLTHPQNKLQSEGKNYMMQDADVCHFLINV